jgi:hypothetical protein
VTLRQHLARVFRDPSLVGAELAWRWVFGASSLALLIFAFVRLQRAVVVLPEEQEMLASRTPLQIAEALLEIWHRIQPLAVRIGLIVIPSIVVLWLIASTVGRGYVIARIVSPPIQTPNWLALALLHLLRIISVILLVGAYVECSRATLLVSSPESPNYLAATLLFLVLFGVSVLVWSLVHWVLSLACVYAVRERSSPVRSIGKTLSLVKTRGRALAGIAAQNGSARTLVAVVFTLLALFPLVVASLPILFWGSEAVILVAYCFVSDLLLLARLGAYVEVAYPVSLSETQAEN